MTNIEKKEGIGGVMENFSKNLKELMEKITGSIKDILVNLGIKKETEKKETEEETTAKLEETEKLIWGDITKKELNELMEDIESDSELTEKEEGIIEKIDDENISKHIDRLEETFELEEIQEREKEKILNELEAITTGESDQTLEEFKNKLNKQQEQIKEDENLKSIIDGFPMIKKPKKGSSIEQIIKAYNLVKKEKEEGEEITDAEVLEKIK